MSRTLRPRHVQGGSCAPRLSHALTFTLTCYTAVYLTSCDLQVAHLQKGILENG